MILLDLSLIEFNFDSSFLFHSQLLSVFFRIFLTSPLTENALSNCLFLNIKFLDISLSFKEMLHLF